jgi:hypothetical protein
MHNKSNENLNISELKQAYKAIDILHIWEFSHWDNTNENSATKMNYFQQIHLGQELCWLIQRKFYQTTLIISISDPRMISPSP